MPAIVVANVLPPPLTSIEPFFEYPSPLIV
jgi:hypothetical protein